nr:TetR/AcrR family transcriptional regulator [Nitratireductor soli]
MLDAALKLFVAHGLEGASFERVAKAAGVTRATIYRRWTARETLLADALGRLKESAEQDFGPWQEMPLETLVGMMVDHGPKAWVDLDAKRLLARIIGSVPDAPDLMGVYWEVYLEPRRHAFNIILERAAKEGALPPETDADVFQDMLGGAMIYELLMKPGEKGEDALRAYFIRLLRQLGLGDVYERYEGARE